MPAILRSKEQRSSSAQALRSANFDYNYPRDLNLKPGSDLHEKILDKLMDRAYESADAMSVRFASWNTIDETLTTYIATDDAEEDVKEADHRKPVSIVYPYSYAVLETMLGYLLAAFFQDPIFRYEGVSSEDVLGAILLEKIIDVHSVRNKIILNLHTMFRDSLSYGFGAVAPTWKKHYGKKITKKVTKRFFGEDKVSRVTKDTLISEGNALINLDPYLCLPDPNVSIAQIQDGEFFGWIDHTNYMDTLSEEGNSEGQIFNVKYLKLVNGMQTSIYPSDESDREKKFGQARLPINTEATNPVDIIYMYVKLIPKEWGLGDGEYPEKWMFGVGADQVIIKAQPLGLGHNMFPIAVASPDFDGYTIAPVSRLETLYGLQHTMDWMFNTHVANVRKAINDTLIVDPYLINVPDLKDPRPGGIVRTRRPAWGRGVKDSVMQLGITDITRGHVADVGILQNAMDKVAGTDAATMGSLRMGGPERLTGKEFEGTRSSAFTRLERIARIIGVQAMQDIGYMFAYHTQQFMSQEVYLSTTGRWQEVLAAEYGAEMGPTARIKADPFDLLIDYDVKVRDGSVPGSNFSGVWANMFEILASHPELQQTFDITRIFKHIARNSGAKNVDEFIRVDRMTDQQAAQQAQAGNIIPINQAMGGVGGI